MEWSLPLRNLLLGASLGLWLKLKFSRAVVMIDVELWTFQGFCERKILKG